jgi:peptidoglycan/LPS O-acetylase OafA/YrhL
VPLRAGEHAGPGSGVVPDAVLPPEGQPRFPLVDATRAIAALSILVFHAAINSRFIENSGGGRLASRLDAGVAIFFVI